MQIRVVQRILGLLLMIFSLSMLPSAIVGMVDGGRSVAPFFEGFLLVLLAGLVSWLPARNEKRELRLRDGFLVVVLFWTVLGLAGSVPFMLSEAPHLSIADAVFESVSALTTTGATVITGLDDLPKSILFYRQQLQWMGGMGIIVLAVAILPMLGIGGMQLYRAETPGPVKDSKLTPRITETAKALWYIYLTLTVACGVAYWAAGMGVFDAVVHSFSTVAIGGFSTHDASIGYFNNVAIESIAIVFMLISGVNYALHFTVWRNHNPITYWHDSEFKTYIILIGLSAMIVIGYLFLSTNTHPVDAVRQGLFQTVSIATTTGFSTADFSVWPAFLPVLLLFLSFSGGCAGSTGGGMKVIRVLLLLKQGSRELKRLIHPNAQFVVKVGNKPTSDTVIEAVWGFFSAYILVFVILMLLVMGSGLDQVTAFSAVAASMNNLGPGLGKVASNYQGISDFAKWVLSFAMIMGRLEIFTLLVLLTPAFWRR
ncbi:MAG TPA: potassium transporter [Chromatiales bacterium]|nr:potassium transporter [Thiotrichales bacterium]HIP67250.1 potassium transporter [Chromatiales bacterium]